MSEIPIAGETCCANCVNDATCSHRSALPGIALICDLFVNRTFPPEVQDAIRAGDRCHICGAPAIIGGGGRVTCGTCLLAQAAAKAKIGDKAIREWRGTVAIVPVPTGDAGADPDDIPEEDEEEAL